MILFFYYDRIFIERRECLYMFCMNCGNRLDENAYVCVNCGVLVKNRCENKMIRPKKKVNSNALGVVSIIFGVTSFVFSLMLYFHDISSVGMYTEVYERIIYALDYSLTSIMMAFVTLIFSLVSKKNIYSTFAFLLSLLSFLFIITEFIVVIIY